MNPIQGALVIQSIVLGCAAGLLGFVIGVEWLTDGDTSHIPTPVRNAFYVFGVLAMVSGIATGWAGAL